MKKALKITGIVIGILLLLIIVVVAALPFIINPNHYKDQIAQAVKDRTGRELTIPGDIKFSIFPWLGVQIGPLELANASGFGSTPFAAVNETDVHVHFWPLLHGRVEVGEVKLDGLNLDLERNAEGHNNWQDMTDRLASRPPTAAAAAEKNGGFDNLSVAGLTVGNSQVRWTDAEKHQQYTISAFKLTMGAFVPAKPVTLTAGFDFAGTNPSLQGHADFKGTAVADLAHRIYSTDDAKLEAQAQGEAVPGGQVQVSIEWQHAVANLDVGTVALNGLSASAYSLTLHVEAQGKDIAKDPNFTGSLKLDAFSPHDLLKSLGRAAFANTRDSSAFGNAVGSFAFVATGSSVALTDVDLKLDDSHVTGKFEVKDFKSRALSFDLDLDQLDADRYLPPQQPGTPDKPREPIDINKISLPLRTLRSLDVDGHLHVGKFGLLNTKATDFEMNMTAHQGLVRINPLNVKLYGGTLGGDLQVDASTDSPVVTENISLKGVQVNGLVQDLVNASGVTGTLELDTHTRAQGRTLGVLRGTLNGRMSFALKHGAVQGVNVWDAIARAYALAKQQPAPPAAPNLTEFADLHGSASIVRGVLTNRDFSGLLPFLSLSGEGKLDLTELTVDYNLKGRVTGTPKLGSTQDLSGLAGTSVPLHVTGTLSSLNVRPDLGGLIKDKLDETLNKKKTEVRKKLQDLINGPGGGG